ncbi:MAG: glutamate racemase, partial [Prevotellaceae bacterium]|nr:glutamate racemase [Prevotellaceae bacterium]
MRKPPLFSQHPGPIGVFDSGYGGLTILEKIRQKLPQYDYLYLGDNARTPYGTRSFEVVYKYTLECVTRLFEMGCHLIIIACNTASAKALRTIQQKDLPLMDGKRRVLGVIRPTVESIGNSTKNKHVGLFATPGTIQSDSYAMEISKIDPAIKLSSIACPLWVPLIENNEHLNAGADYFVSNYLEQLFAEDEAIDTILLGCTHYPLIVPKIKKALNREDVSIISQGGPVADSLANYLNRHPEIEAKCTKNSNCVYYTTESEEKFASSASVFLAE